MGVEVIKRGRGQLYNGDGPESKCAVSQRL